MTGSFEQGPKRQDTKAGSNHPREVKTVNARQKHVLLVGILLVGLAATYPPWNLVDQYFSYSRLEVERFAGYSFFFAPPAPNPPTNACSNLIATVSRLDTRRLAVEWVAIVLVVIGLLLLLRSRPILPQASGFTKSPLADPGSTEARKTSSLRGRPPPNVSRNPPIETAKPSEGTRKIMEFLMNADRREFNAATAAILQGLKIGAREQGEGVPLDH